MRVLSRYLLVAAILAVAGLGVWRTGRLQQRSAEAHRHLLTLMFDAPLEEYEVLGRDLRYLRQAPILSGIDDGIRQQRATSSYWRGRFDELVLKASPTGEVTERDPALLLLAANAAYRSAAIDESSPAAVQRMEGLVSQYSDALRRGRWQFDAAYNYEFIAKRRDQLIRARGKGTQKRPDAAALGVPQTIHGRAGSVPPGADMSEFKIVVPQRSDERREQPEAGKGGPKARKG